MKNTTMALMLAVAMAITLSACGTNDSKVNPTTTPAPTEQVTPSETDNNNSNGGESKPTEAPDKGEAGNENGEGANAVNGSSTPAEMVEAILAVKEQPMFADADATMVKDMYYFDPALVDQFAAKMPMVNIKTNEIAIFKLKDVASLSTVEEGLKKRALDVQKQFETYLQDQYENAKNYKIAVQGNYVLFVITDDADAVVKQFNGFFAS